MIPFPRFDPSTVPTTGVQLSPAEALRIAAQLTDTEEDLHAITRVVLALVGADDDLTGAAADAALTDAGIPAEARRLLMAALGPTAGRPSVVDLRTGLEAALTAMAAASAPRSGLAGLFDELRRRRVIRTALWYAAASVAIVEAASLFLPTLGASDGVVRFLAIAAVCGLPVALTLSWVYDVSPAHTSRPRHWPRLALLAGVVVLSVAGAAAIWNAGSGVDGPAGSAVRVEGPDPAHIAVLGFGTGDDEDLAAFAAQLHVRLIDGLSIAAGSASGTPRRMRVLSYAGVLPFMRTDFAIDSLRVARKVGTLLDGTIERTTDSVNVRVRVRLRLVDTQTGDQIHTGAAEVLYDDRVALLDAVADTVARLVRLRLGQVVLEHMRLLETRNAAAFDRLGWAMHRMEEFPPAFNRADYRAAARVLSDVDSLLADAERHDRRWTEPIVGRGRVAKWRAQLAYVNGERSTVVSEIRRGLGHVERALALDANDVHALEVRGDLRQFHLTAAYPSSEGEAQQLHDAAAADLRASLMGHPQPARPLRLLSELAGSAGHMQEALTYGERAYDEDPFMEQVHFTVFRLFEYSLALRQDAQAARWCTEGAQRFDLPVFYDCRLSLASWSGIHALSPDNAWALVAAELDAHAAGLRPNLEPRLHAMVAAVLARRGMGDSARAVLHQARGRDTSAGMLRATAGVFSLLGETDSALIALRELVDRTPLSQRRTLQLRPELRIILDDPRARVLLDVQPAPAN